MRCDEGFTTRGMDRIKEQTTWAADFQFHVIPSSIQNRTLIGIT